MINLEPCKHCGKDGAVISNGKRGNQSWMGYCSGKNCHRTKSYSTKQYAIKKWTKLNLPTEKEAQMSDQKDDVIFVDLAFDRDVTVQATVRLENGIVTIEDYKVIERQLTVREEKP